MPARRSLLLVEDDAILRHILSVKFALEGFAVETVASAEEGLGALRRLVPDVMVLDVMLPGMSGFDMLRTVREEAAYAALPVVMLSNLDRPEKGEDAAMLGEVRYMVKADVTAGEIADYVREACMRHQAVA